MSIRSFKLLILSALLLLNALQSKAFSVNFKFNGYTGNYFMDYVQSTLYQATGNTDTSFDLAEGWHTFIANGYVSTELGFNVDGDGTITNLSNSIAATVICNKSANTIGFNVASIIIDPKNAVYSFSLNYFPYHTYDISQKPETFILIKGFEYYIATQYSDDYIHSPDSLNYSIPELFFFYVDQNGNARRSIRNKSIVDKLAASYRRNTVTLQTVKIHIKASDFNAMSVRIGGHDYITDADIFFIKGLGVSIFYDQANEHTYYYFIPL